MSQVAQAGTGEPPALSRKAMEDAAADARHLMANSSVVPKLVALDILARQMFLAVRGALENEIKSGWEVEEPDLVIHTLGLSAQEYAVQHPGTAKQLRESLLTTGLPVIDIFCLMEDQQNEQQQSTATPAPTTPVPGDDPGTPDELGALSRGADGHAELQAGECGEGNPGEA